MKHLIVAFSLLMVSLSTFAANVDTAKIIGHLKINPAVIGSLAYASKVAGAPCGAFKLDKTEGSIVSVLAICNKPNESQVNVTVTIETYDGTAEVVKSIDFDYAG